MNVHSPLIIKLVCNWGKHIAHRLSSSVNPYHGRAFLIAEYIPLRTSKQVVSKAIAAYAATMNAVPKRT